MNYSLIFTAIHKGKYYYEPRTIYMEAGMSFPTHVFVQVTDTELTKLPIENTELVSVAQ